MAAHLATVDCVTSHGVRAERWQLPWWLRGDVVVVGDLRHPSVWTGSRLCQSSLLLQRSRVAAHSSTVPIYRLPVKVPVFSRLTKVTLFPGLWS